jgi:WD40 repeat protein
MIQGFARVPNTEISNKRYSQKKLPAGFSVAFSKDGTKLACSGTRVHILDPESLERISIFKPFPNICAIDFAPSGKEILVKNTEGKIAIIEAITGELLATNLTKPTREGCRARFSVDGSYIINGDWDGTLSIHSAASCDKLREIRHAHELIRDISLNRIGTAMIVEHQPKVFGEKQVPDKSYLMIHNLPLSETSGRRLDFKKSISNARLSNDGTKVAFVEEVIGKKGAETVILGAKLKIAEILTGTILSESDDFQWYKSLEWSVDDKHIFTAIDGHFVLHEVTSLERLWKQPAEFTSSIAFHPNGDLVALGTWKTTLLVQLSKLLN